MFSKAYMIIYIYIITAKQPFILYRLFYHDLAMTDYFTCSSWGYEKQRKTVLCFFLGLNMRTIQLYYVNLTGDQIK